MGVQPSSSTIRRIARCLRRLLQQSRRLARLYLDASRLARNPALADVLEDYSSSEQTASVELEELLVRIGADPPFPRRHQIPLAVKLSMHFRPESTDASLQRYFLKEETKRSASLEQLQADLSDSGADPEALQRLSEIHIAALQRRALFQEHLRG